jgi:NAD(P)-dependent dehydrogenase (short-subunit alcohol dehydrogenase family)
MKYRALITGGTRGIGRAIAERLVRDGMEVFITGRSECTDVPASCRQLKVDFLSDNSRKAFIAEIGGMEFDVAINNAGINKIAPFCEIDPNDFDEIHTANLKAPFEVCQAVLPHMISRGWGRIVNISSILGHIGREFRASYSASKFGLDGMTAALAAEVAKKGILANCVGPGFIDTDLTREVLGEDGMKKLSSTIPIGRLGQPEEIAALVCWLAGPNNTYLSGQNIIIDGGFSRV